MVNSVNIDFDSVRTHAHAITTVLLIATATGMYAFHHPHSKVIPFIILTSVLVCVGLGTSTLYLQEQTAVQRLLCQMKRSSVLCGLIWCGWLVYGSVWEREHRMSGYWDTITALVWLLSGLWSTMRLHQQRTVHYVVVLGIQLCLLYIPIESSVAQFLPAWNVLIRVTAYVLTFFSNMYVRVATEESVDSAHLVCTSLWILYVNKWMLPAVCIHWMVQLHALTKTYSKRPKRIDTHETALFEPAEPEEVLVVQAKEKEVPPNVKPRKVSDLEGGIKRHQKKPRFFFKNNGIPQSPSNDLIRAAAKVPSI